MGIPIDQHNGDALVKMIQQWPKEQFVEFQQLVLARAEEFRAVLKEVGISEFVRQFYEVFDDAMVQEKPLVSCSKGCHFCCRQNVHTFPAEAQVIAAYCKEKEIEIPKDYLTEQLKYGWRELAKTEVGWCVFLKNGECSIYPVRPSACRSYFVVSPPERCDVVKYPSSEGHRVVVKTFPIPLMLQVAFAGVLTERRDEGGTLAEMMLPYSK
jgi:Fe-S-cluster containining protein